MNQSENVLTLLGQVERDITLAARMVKGATRSYNRLGDFLVARGACERVIDRLQLLIAAEQYAPVEEDLEPEVIDATIHHTAKLNPKTKRALVETAKLAGRALKKPPAPPTTSQDDSLADLLLVEMRKEPLASAALHQRMHSARPGTPIASVYSALSLLKKAGQAETFDLDGVRCWRAKK